MFDNTEEINRLFTSVFENILHEESQNIKKLGLDKVTLNEIHVIVKIRDLKKKKGKVVSKDLMEELNVTKGTLSVVITRLEKKGYLRKQKNNEDLRSLYLELREPAYEVIQKHDLWHELLVKIALKDITDDEKVVLKKILEKIQVNMKNIINPDFESN